MTLIALAVACADATAPPDADAGLEDASAPDAAPDTAASDDSAPPDAPPDADSSACEEDLAEPDDSPAQATALTPGSVGWWSLCPGDVDHRRLALAAGERLEVRVEAEAPDGALALHLLAPDGRPLARDTLRGGGAVVSTVAFGDVLVRVRSAAAARLDYTLEAEVTAAEAACEGDDEPDDSPAQARPLVDGAARVACGDDVDWVQLPVGGQSVTVATLEAATPGLRLTLLDESGQLELDRDQRSDASLAVTALAEAPRLLLLRVENPYPAPIPYALHAAPPPIACRDALDPNAGPTDATPLGQGATRGLELCGAQEDWFSVAVAPQETLRVVATLEGNAAPLVGLEVRDADGQRLAWGAAGVRSTALTWRAPRAQTVYLRAWLLDGEWTRYGLELLLDRAVEPLECADAWEPSSPEAPVLLPEGDLFRAVVCPGEEDGYLLPVEVPGSLLRVVTSRDPLFGLASFALLDPGGREVARTPGVATTESLEVLATVAGPWTLRAWLAHGDTTAYEGRWTLLAPPRCADDPHEPNDAPGDAPPLDARVEGVLCPGDVDRFALDLATPWTAVTLDVAHPGAFGALELTLTDPEGTAQGALTLPASGRLEVTLPRAGRYLVNLRLAEDATAAAYSLQASLQDRRACLDADEPNDTLEHATPLLFGARPALTLCPDLDPIDRYTLQVAAGDRVDIEAGFDVQRGDLELVLADATLQTVASSRPTRLPRALTYTAPRDGTLHLQVRHLRGALLPYTLYATLTPDALPGCDDDPAEEDDTPALARHVAPGRYTGVACPQDPDLLGVFVPAGQTLYAHLIGPPQVELALDLFDSDGETLLASAALPAGDERAAAYAPRADTRFVRVRALGAQAGAYQLDLSVGPDLNAPCFDRMEPNNTPQTAAPLAPGTLTALDLCPGGVDREDWFALPLELGQRLQIEARFNPRDADLDLKLYAPDGTQRAASTSATSSEERVQIVATQPGVWLLQVYHFRGDVASYTLHTTLDDAALPPCVEDPFEDDDAPAQARRAQPGLALQGQICFADEDWVVFTAPQGATLHAQLTSDLTQGDLNLYLWSPDLSTRLAAAESTWQDIERLTAVLPEEGAYYLQINPAGASQGPWSLTWTLDPPHE